MNSTIRPEAIIELKDEANRAFASGDYGKAVRLYKRGLEHAEQY